MYDPLAPKKPDDPGYVVAWKYKSKFETGHFDEPMTYGQAREKAEELSAQDPEKTFWAQKVVEPPKPH
jgi:hypothetical protein